MLVHVDLRHERRDLCLLGLVALSRRTLAAAFRGDLRLNLNLLRRALTSFGSLAARPSAFLVAAAYGGLWFTFGHSAFDWNAGATLATLMMTLFIQRSEHRDTQALHAKLDELLHAGGAASSAMTKLDDLQPEEIEEHRAAERMSD